MDFEQSYGAAPYLFGSRDFNITGYVQVVAPCCQVNNLEIWSVAKSLLNI